MPYRIRKQGISGERREWSTRSTGVNAPHHCYACLSLATSKGFVFPKEARKGTRAGEAEKGKKEASKKRKDGRSEGKMRGKRKDIMQRNESKKRIR